MAWTTSDADALRAAILKLATGTRVVTASYTGPPARQVSYQIGDLAKMRELLAEVDRSASGGTTYRLASVNKGLGS